VDFNHNLFALMPVLPLLGWLVLIVWGKNMKEPTPGIIASSLVFLSFVLAVVGFVQVSPMKEPLLNTLRWDFLPIWVLEKGQLVSKPLQFGFALDHLSSIMTLIITGIGFLIHVFAIGYMHGDKGFSRFFAYLNFFIGMMLILVLADSYPVLFIGWEGVGVASYLLIGFWYTDRKNSDAARKAFIVNRIGDAFLMLGMFLLFMTFQTLNIHEINSSFGSVVIPNVTTISTGIAFGSPPLELAALFLLLGAAGKSAQLPLSTWLPDAMAGPTPVSALIHAATMVTAGVYLVARSHGIFANAPGASSWVMWIGALTAVYGALSAIAQTDIKKILAYSTVSQLGYMFIAVGSGAYWVGIFHVATHAFFKALLFLSSGSVIHALDGEQDVRQMGGLREKLPTTHIVSLIGTLAIAGIIPLAGFFSKDAILSSAFTSPFGGEFSGYLIWAIGLIVAFLTAGYMWRWYTLVFLGTYRGHAHPHESSSVMTVPLWILAVLSVVGGFIGLPHFLGKNVNWLEGFLEEAAPNALGFREIPIWGEAILIALALAAAVGGILFSRWIIARDGVNSAGWIATRFGNASRKALFLDQTYDIAVSAPAKFVSEQLELADTHGLDRGIGAIANGTAEAGASLSVWQSGFVRAYAIAVLLGTAILVGYLALRSFA
jgi:NADH-quinone oxidoreductase subunit L